MDYVLRGEVPVLEALHHFLLPKQSWEVKLVQFVELV